MSTKTVTILLLFGSLILMGLLVKIVISILNTIDERKNRKQREKWGRIQSYKTSMKEDFEDYFSINERLMKNEIDIGERPDLVKSIGNNNNVQKNKTLRNRK